MSTLSLVSSQLTLQMDAIKSKLHYKKSDSLETINYSMKSRHSLVKDIMDENGIRQVVGCLPIDPVNKRYLFINIDESWSIPEGNWDQDMETQKQSAMRETWELAGIQGTITRLIGVFAEKSPTGIKAHHSIYELEIKKVKQKFPEMNNCQRRWMAYNEAMLMIRSPYIQDALVMSSLSPLAHQYTLEPEKKKKKNNKNKDDDDDDDDESQEVKTKNKKQDDNCISSSHSIEVEQINDPMRNMSLFSQTNKEQTKDEQSR